MKFLDNNGLMYLWAKINSIFLKEDTVNTMIAKAIENAKLEQHPIGSFYWSKNNTDPSELFGGTWERVKDVFLYALGDDGKAGDTDGKLNITLTKKQIPTLTGSTNATGKHSHTHLYVTGSPVGFGSSNGSGFGLGYSNNTRNTGAPIYTAESDNHDHTVTITNDNQSTVDITPPRLKAYCWERVA